MKEKIKEIEIKNSTFHNFKITNDKSNISLKLIAMNEKEYNDIKLMKAYYMQSKNKNNKQIKDNIENSQHITTEKNNHDYPLLEKKEHTILKKIKNRAPKKISNIKINSNSSFYNSQNNTLISLYNKNFPKKVKITLKKIDNNIKKINKECSYIKIENTIDHNLSEEKNRNKMPSIIKYKDDSNSIIHKNFKSFINLDEYNNKNCIGFGNNNNNYKKSKIKNLKNINRFTPFNKYFITSDNFTSLPRSLNNRKIFNHNNEIKTYNNEGNNNFFSLNKSFNSKGDNYKIANNPHKIIKTNNNSFEGTSKNKNDKIKKIQKVNLSYDKCLELENNFNKSYYNNILDINEKTKKIKNIKEKCKNLIKDLDKKNNFEIQQIIKEINTQLLSLGFNDFFRYLLTILKNYDKKIVDWSFDIIEEKKECPEELKFQNVKNRHKKFMNLLNKQYVSGVNANNHMDSLIKNSKNKLGFNNVKNYNKFNLKQNITQRDKYKDNLFTESNYRSKIYESFLKNKNNNI